MSGVAPAPPPLPGPTSSQREFEAILSQAGNKLVVVDFTASWCPPCQRIAPEFEKLAEENKDVIFIKVDVDDAPDVAQKCDIRSMPTFQFYKNGNKMHEFSGANKDMLISKVRELK